MARSYKGYCIDYLCQKIKNGEKYKFCKRCSFCGVFLNTTEIRCPCCKVVLRTNPRNGKIRSIINKM